MGEVNINTDAVLNKYWDMLEERIAQFAEGIRAEAQQRAPVRKSKGDRRRGSRRDFIPGGVYELGKISITSKEIARAADRIGINLGTSAAIRHRATGRNLQIVVRKPQRDRTQGGYGVTPSRGGKPDPRRLSNAKYMRRADAIANYEDRPGRLRRSITTEANHGQLKLRVTVRADAPYARYVEFPTSRTAAQPFLLPAIKNARSRMKRRMAKGYR